MGERGPRPKPNAIRRNNREVTGTASVASPAMPSHLSAEAQAEWRRIVPDVERMGLLTNLDRGLLIRYCTAWADWVDLDAQLAKSGRLVKGPRGEYVRNPLWLLRRDAGDTATELSRQLGLTPDARIRAGIKHEVPLQKTTAPAGTQVSDFVAERRRRIIAGG